MNIAVIGGGFYGCYLSSKLGIDYNVTIYEKSKKLMTGAATNNQNRLHLGYHYPRSRKTIEQILESYKNNSYE